MPRHPGYVVSEETKAKIAATLKGRSVSPKSEFKKGEAPWNAGTRTYTHHVCAKCKKEFDLITGYAGSGRYCSTECAYSERKGEKHGNWKGGRWLNGVGYWMINVSPGLVRHEHVLIAEGTLGRPLRKGEVVHHLNGDKQDNDRRNLLICTNSYHLELHARMSQRYARAHFPSYRKE